MYRHSVKLSELLDGIHAVPAALDTQLHGMTLDSRMVKQGDVFIALSGATSRATDHVAEAIEKGAVAVVVEGEMFKGRVHEDGSAVEIFVPELRSYLGDIASRFFQHASDVLTVLGVTGTNGKTSVVNFIASFFEKVGKKAGVVGTLGYGFPTFGAEHIKETNHTTPDVVNMHRYLSWLRDEGAEYAALEVSSHGLDQGRVDGIHFDIAIFTNLTREHLDYHSTIEAYAEAKRKLFEREEIKLAVINADDAYARFMQSVISKPTETLTYGVEQKADIQVEQAEYSLEGIKAKVSTPLGMMDLESSLIGQFNLSNLLAVVAMAIGLNIRLEKIASAVNAVSSIEGRMQKISGPGTPLVVVDYAHTPDALEKLLSVLRPLCAGSLNVIFGCGGDRDQGKRPEMAQIAEKYADKIAVTDDNPRHEDPEQIIDQIMLGFSGSSNVIVQRDRKLAIESMIELSKEDDLVVIAGKGHERFQEIKGERTEFSDASVAVDALGIDVDSVCDAEGVGCD